MIAWTPNDDYEETQQVRICKEGQTPCIICGRPCSHKTTKTWLHLHEGGSMFVTEGEAETLAPGLDLGMWPIGTDCLRQRPELKPYVQVQEFA